MEKMNAKDWHRAEIKCELEKKGISLAKLSRANGLNGDTLRNVFSRKWPKGEKIVADAIGVKPEEIWPSRYPVNS
ncbi:helix-turn-helix transcriptional regulator [Kingella kingae]|nr:helix-turn-helix transcriptional regulator [Kingella kingae]EIC13972.1 maltose metabolism regulator [Kingella kingae PYKK081]MDK4567884.1 helix-turn-helix transcriptional regulator [Kingella kingae]MDK4569803.1 helix-turn-helix transcriptional regulator [Kingella kingae]MDK4571804.1 helix-turn-helix transcriptional regulator [Kingella kingae]MDK4574862.1 helix-turn-helix transcriptional regulator [Kingella kingae]